MPKAKTKTKNHKSLAKKPLGLTTAAAVVPDELRADDGITVSRVTAQCLASDDPLPGENRMRVLDATYIPERAGEPMRVVGVCLPFVTARHPDGRHETLDMRRHHLVKLDRDYVKAVFKALRPKTSKKKKKR